MRRAAWLLLLSCCSGGARPIALIFPADTRGASTALIAIEPASGPARFFAVALSDPAPITVTGEAPVLVSALLFRESLSDLGIEAGAIEDTPGGSALPFAVLALSAEIEPDLEATWSVDQTPAEIFESLHLPVRDSVCRTLRTSIGGRSALGGRALLFAHERSPERTYLGTVDGTIFALDASLEITPLEHEDGVNITAMTRAPDGEYYVADLSGKIGRITSVAAATRVTVDLREPAIPTAAAIRDIAVSDEGHLAAIAGNILWLNRGAGWSAAHTYNVPPNPRAALRFDGATLTAVQSPARYILELDAAGTARTTTISAKGLSALAMETFDGETALYAGDDVGAIWRRGSGGRWSLHVDTTIADRILDLRKEGEKLLYVGVDGWGGTWIPDFGLCPHGAIMPNADHAATLAGHGVYFGTDEIVQVFVDP